MAHCTAVFKIRAGWCNTCCCKNGLVDFSVHSNVVAHDDSHGHRAFEYTAYCHHDTNDKRSNIPGIQMKKGVSLKRDFTVFQNFKASWGGCTAWFNVADMLVRAVASMVRTGILAIRYGNG